MTLMTSLPGTQKEQRISANLSYNESELGKTMSEECKELYERYLFYVNSNLSQQADHYSGENVYLSSVNDLTLDQFIVVRKWYCKLHHKDVTSKNCIKCQQLIDLAVIIRDKGFCELSALYRQLFPSLKYQSDKASRKLMQLPVAIFKLKLNGPGSQKLYVCEIRQMVDYKAFSQLCETVLSSNSSQKQGKGLTREALDVLCNLASTESDRCLIKYSVCKSQGLSAKAARKNFGFNDFHEKEDVILRSVEQAQAIRQAVMRLASVKNKSTLRSLGYDVPDDSDTSNSDSSDFEDDDYESIQRVFHSDVSDAEDLEQPDGVWITSANPSNEVCQSQTVHVCSQPVTMECRSSVFEDLEQPEAGSTCITGTRRNGNAISQAHHSQADTIDSDSISKSEAVGMLVDPIPSMEHMLFMLRSNELNWFAFVGELKMLLQGLTADACDQVLIDFAHYLSGCNLDVNEERLVEQSRQAYLERERQCITAENSDTLSDSESDNPDDWVEVDDIASKQAKEMVAKQWKRLKQRSRIKAAKAIAQAGLLKRRVTKKVSRILQKYPNIGKDIEEFVTEQKVGADAWRRTGVLTFSYGKNYEESSLKVTYKRIRKHLEKKYQAKLSHGTIVQLCVARNKRRISAKRYKGVAKVTCRRARKGFGLKLNPDAHYSTAMYSCLDKLQKKDGRDSLILNRDDAAGFRLDSTYTHRQHCSLSLSDDVELTTRADYQNKYSSTLQVSSYMFLDTETTPEVSVGVVKAHKLHPKSPAQHMADLRMLEETSDFKGIFNKQIEFIRVDGGGDENPSHAEVQFMWTERHLSKATDCLLVTTRHSGGSYLNKVELLNGCLARAHSNIFIPSTIGGACKSSEQLNKNLNLAIDVYLKRVNGAPCGNGTVSLLKGSSSEFAKYANDRRPKLLTFLGGTKKEKKALKELEPTLYTYFEEVWEVRSRHMVKNLPKQYVFMLTPCFQENCPHNKCQESDHKGELKWFPNGPPLDYFPLPIPDPNRPWGGQCCKCQGKCAGHFLSQIDNLTHFKKHGTKGMMPNPPSKMLSEEHKKLGANKPSEEQFIDLAKKTLLTTEHVKMWFKHLDVVQKNRAEGAKKAKAKKGGAKKQLKASQKGSCKSSNLYY